MTITIYPVTPDFAAEIGDVNLASIADSDMVAIKQVFWKYAVLVFPDQNLSGIQHVEFARRFGALETSIAAYRPGEKLRVQEEIADVSNLDPEDKLLSRDSRQRMYNMGNRLWHTDSSFRHVPAFASVLYARSVAPIGGHTEFADLRAAFDSLPQPKQDRLRGLVAEHSIFHSRAKLGFYDFAPEERAALPPATQVMVRRIPENGRESLYIASHAARVIGMPEDEGAQLIEELTAHAVQRQFVYTHRWRQNDLVIWDNRCTMHRGTEFDDMRWRRDFQRATVADIANSCARTGVPIST
jgi:alpha-ketoglutarate-dependent 2,4-dichlorophenoxyacetate dioxygenase